MAKLRVVSYNIHKGRSLGGRDSLPELRLGLHGLHADILFLQEVQGRNEQRANLDAQHESLAAALHMQVAYGCNAVRQMTDHGNALLSRYPILSFENEDVSDHPLEQRGLLHGQVDIEGRCVHCFVVHLGLFAGSRMRQIQTMAQRIERLVGPHEPVLIAGDFNDWRNELAPLFVKQLGVYEVFTHASQSLGDVPRLRDSVRQIRQVLRGQQPLTALSRDRQLRQNQLSMAGAESLQPPPKTYPSKFPMLRLDRIYQRGFAVKRAQVLRGKPWSLLSDHSPIVADLELE
ncbi:MAG: endonuclease/exonuclease/phosphatase family protein [Burkholderiaceae bacterium]|nr:endonuclease/exonuclease/phosphatase family protein [Burkholderiaceae bacterium]MCD8517280.1 endonuclease/exonuclease/phosphatase family protein [Burkholderiaceae bacterium]MCD8537814.1 endonuclease/exonuclease/phosphatase family protein [Burkholderiaceae bacterium]MCD8564568.1 endonuclease/exonuclease/phosphatase family protein [Burkholderiaceae bacterium]